jgi:hypothetical protein
VKVGQLGSKCLTKHSGGFVLLLWILLGLDEVAKCVSCRAYVIDIDNSSPLREYLEPSTTSRDI